MKRITLLSILIFFCFIGLFSSLSAEELPFYGNEDSYSNLPPQKIVITYNKSNPPFKFLDEKGIASGVLIDIWRIWSKKTGIKVEFKEALFSDTIRMIQDNEADIHAGLFYTTERDKFLEYNLPLIEIGYYIFYHKTLFSIKRLVKTYAQLELGFQRA